MRRSRPVVILSSRRRDGIASPTRLRRSGTTPSSMTKSRRFVGPTTSQTIMAMIVLALSGPTVAKMAHWRTITTANLQNLAMPSWSPALVANGTRTLWISTLPLKSLRIVTLSFIQIIIEIWKKSSWVKIPDAHRTGQKQKKSCKEQKPGKQAEFMMSPNPARITGTKAVSFTMVSNEYNTNTSPDQMALWQTSCNARRL